MKKVLVVFMMVAMLLQLGAGFLVSAADAAGTYKLVAYWDFEGDTPYVDKATEGVADPLTANGDVSVTDGIASVPAAAGSYMVASGKTGTDLNDMTDKTILTKMSISDEGARKVVAAFMAKVDTFAYGVQISDSDGKYVGYAPISYVFYNKTAADGTSKVNNTAANGSVSLVVDEFRMFATTFDHDSETNKVTVNQYMSTKEAPESAADFILVNTETVEAANLKTEGDFILGKRFGHQNLDRKLNVSFDEVKVFDGILTTEQMVTESPEKRETPAEPLAPATRAYTVGDKFVAYIQADDPKYVTVGNGGSWKVADIEGAMDGKALYCETKAADASGDGITLTFSVPTDGTYAIWARSYYPTHSNNSMFYSIDGEGNSIWDYPDEDDTAICYKSWQYFYLTKRDSGTFTDTAEYGTWTIQNNEWRHAPNTMSLKAGQHTIKLTGREAGMYIDEFVITSYGIDEYDPNAFEGNTATLDICKFCGTNWKHYVSDIYAQKDITAASYFVNTLHTDAVEWTIPEVTPPTSDTEPSDTSTDTTPTSDTEAEETKKQLYTKAEEETESDSSAASDTEAPNESGCGSVIGVSVLAVSSLALALAVKRRREDQ